MNPNFRNFALWVVIFLLVIALVTLFNNPGQRSSSLDMSYSTLLQEARPDAFAGDHRGAGSLRHDDGRAQFHDLRAANDPTFVATLREKGVRFPPVRPPTEGNWFMSLLINLLPILLFAGIWIFMSRQMQSGAGRAMGFGKSKAKLLTEAHGRITFEDVAGIEEAKEDLQEDRRVPARSAEVPAPGRPHSARRAAGRPLPAPARR